MQSDIQITNRNDTCFVDIEGVIGVPEEWQFDDPADRVATYERFRDAVRRIAEVLSDGADALARARYAGYRDAC